MNRLNSPINPDELTLDSIAERWKGISPPLYQCLTLRNKYQWSDEKTALVCLEMMLIIVEKLEQQLYEQLAKRPAPIVVIRKD